MHFVLKLLDIITEVSCCYVSVIFYFCFLACIDILGHYLFILAQPAHLWLALSICTSNCFGISSLQLPHSPVLFRFLFQRYALPSKHTCCVPLLEIDMFNAKNLDFPYWWSDMLIVPFLFFFSLSQLVNR